MTTAAPPTLVFPPSTFAALSPRPYLLAHLQPSDDSRPPLRPSGRSPSEFRIPTVHTSSLTYANGSAVVRIGDTACVCGVRAELLPTHSIPAHTPSKTPLNSRQGTETIESLSLLVPNIELSTGCSPAHLPGNPPSTLAQTLSQRILNLLHSTDLISLEDLTIRYTPPSTQQTGVDEDEYEPPEVAVKAYWVLYIDTVMISLSGNPFDAAWASVLAALKDTKLPRAWWDADRQQILCSPDISEGRPLTINQTPIVSTFVMFVGDAKARDRRGQWLLADPDTFEEDLCSEYCTVVVDCDRGKTRILGIEKVGGRVLGRAEIGSCVELAEHRWKEWAGLLRNLREPDARQ